MEATAETCVDKEAVGFVVMPTSLCGARLAHGAMSGGQRSKADEGKKRKTFPSTGLCESNRAMKMVLIRTTYCDGSGSKCVANITAGKR